MTLLQDVLDHARRLPGVREDFPFDLETLTLKVAGKIFLLTSLRADPVRLNLKCDPGRALELRARYPEHVLPGYHMNKRHWNTLVLDGTLPRRLVEELIDHSYARVLAGLPRRVRAALARSVEEGEAK
ncbi:MmcQ/YjbR family DNA-binding protein [Oceanithermus sp.]|uniref:MmcQ/YjbR family DNA-binding protein n=1 Tax=Oceanithermus sp. TaxID=2268145 RepID=UPI00257AEE82|nr:MmcQ/YjbR family DNA-binding protein [Oceanithermus sp.]